MINTETQQIERIEKEDIQAPELEVGGTAIVLQRHEKYERGRDLDMAGSIHPEAAEETFDKDVEFFESMLDQEVDGAETMVLFISSDTQYAGKGRRSLETAQLAQDAAQKTMEARGIDPHTRIINFNPSFRTRTTSTGQHINPDRRIREPKMFDDNPDFVKELGKRFNPPELQEDIEARRTDVQLSPRAFAAYEADDPEVQEMIEEHGAEGVRDIIDRTQRAVKTYQRYAQAFHAKNPGKRLVIWAASHYDTISPLVKTETDTGLDAYLPVDYGAGIVMTMSPESSQLTLEAQGKHIPMSLGAAPVGEMVTVEPVNQ